MSTISSLSNNSSYGTNTKNVSGLASGLDTDEIIKGMTTGTRSKIAKQSQSKQLLSWQTDAYRSISNKLISFSKKYTSYTSSTNLSSPSFYLQNDITTSGSNSSKVSVSGTSTSTGSLSIISASEAVAGTITSERPNPKLMESGTIDPTKIAGLAGKEMTFSYNGTAKTIILDAGVSDMATLNNDLTSKLNTAFGPGKITVATNGDKLTFKTSETAAGPLGILKITGINDASKAIIGLGVGDSNRLNMSQKLIDVISPPVLNIGGDTLDLAGVATIQDLINKVNSSDKGIKMSYIESLDKFEFTSTKGGGEISITGNVAEKLFGGDPIKVPLSTEATMTVKYGAEEIQLTSSTNTFSLDGLSIKINDKFDSKIADGGDAVKLSLKTDSSKVLTSIKDMVKDYNEMVDLVNTELTTKRNRNYAPLTDEQREGMSESEIKAWEEKSKSGMLFGNSDMSALSSDLRTVFFSSGVSIAKLESVGISTSTNWRENGKIIIDEEKLKIAIDSDPENIQKIFSDKLTELKDADGKAYSDTTSGGVMSRLQSLTNKYAKTEGATKGILVEKAGNSAAPLSLMKNSLLDKMDALDALTTNLKRTLATEQKRYRTQFTNLESVISRLNAQSGWLSKQ